MPRAVYLSPHQDDICFSLGALGRRLGGILINIFTISGYTEPALALSGDPDVVSQIRDEEDRQFAVNCGLTRHNLGLLDSPLRGQAPFDAANLTGEIELLRPVLNDLLARLIHPDRKSLLFC